MGDTTGTPMTTVFTQSDFCTELFASSAEKTRLSLPTVTRSWPSDENNSDACYPYVAGYGPFSPGWYCPAGYVTASTSSLERSSILEVYCCPSGYLYNIFCMKTTSDVRVYSTDADSSPYFLTFPTAVVYANEFWLRQPLGADIPPTPTPTGPTDDDDDDGSGGQSDSGSTDGSGSSGLSTGAKAGIGVGVALAVIIIVVVALFLWLRKRKASKKTSSGMEITYVGDNAAPELEDTGKTGVGNGTMEATTAYQTSHNELAVTENQVAASVPRGEELDSTQRAELQDFQRTELESRERRGKHEPETGMSATVRDVPELMLSAEYYELEDSRTEPSSEVETTTVPAPAPSGEERQLSELEQIEVEEEKLRKRRAELVASQQQGK